MLTGLLAGAAVSVKIWFAVPLLVILVWQWRRSRAAGLISSAAAITGAAVIAAPFFAAAPGQMWSMVVTDQFGRAVNGKPIARLTGVTGLRPLAPQFTVQHAAIVIAVGAIGLVAICLAAWRAPAAGIVLTLFLAQLLMLGIAPSWFPFYADFAASGFALTVAAAASTLLARAIRDSRRARWLAASASAAVAVVLVALTITAARGWVRPYPANSLQAAVAHTGCVMSDSPMPQIELNVLTRGLRSGCPNWIDVDGAAFEMHVSGMASRRASTHWQRTLEHYLLSGDALTLFWPHDPGFGPDLTSTLRRLPVLACSGHFCVLQTNVYR